MWLSPYLTSKVVFNTPSTASITSPLWNSAPPYLFRSISCASQPATGTVVGVAGPALGAGVWAALQAAPTMSQPVRATRQKYFLYIHLLLYLSDKSTASASSCCNPEC